MSRLLPSLLLVIVLSGCMAVGRDFPAEPVKTITTDVTTQREIFAMFGEPDKRGLENGYETWTYTYQYYEFGQLRDSKELYVVFDKGNTVRAYSYNAK